MLDKRVGRWYASLMLRKFREEIRRSNCSCTVDCRDFQCRGCGVCTLDINEYYMVHDEVWLAANPRRRGMLCIGCLEGRLGRLLTNGDFTPAPINTGFFDKSERLADRYRTK